MHKFGSFRKRSTTNFTTLTPLLRWIVPTNVNHRPVKVSSRTWHVFCQESFVIAPKSTKTVQLPIGVELSDGVIMTSLPQDLRVKGCSLQNEITLESAKNLFVIIQNNSDRKVSILEGTLLCLVSYAK